MCVFAVCMLLCVAVIVMSLAWVMSCVCLVREVYMSEVVMLTSVGERTHPCGTPIGVIWMLSFLKLCVASFDVVCNELSELGLYVFVNTFIYFHNLHIFTNALLMSISTVIVRAGRVF